jgi:hypothetical protein
MPNPKPVGFGAASRITMGSAAASAAANGSLSTLISSVGSTLKVVGKTSWSVQIRRGSSTTTNATAWA